MAVNKNQNKIRSIQKDSNSKLTNQRYESNKSTNCRAINKFFIIYNNSTTNQWYVKYYTEMTGNKSIYFTVIIIES